MNNNNELKSPSLVTPDKKPSIFQSTVFQVIAGLIILFLLIAFFNGSSRASDLDREENQNEGKPHNTTLNQNLARLNEIKKAELEKKQQSDEERFRAILKAQQQRMMNPATANGETIGNPRAYRDKPRRPKINPETLERLASSTTFLNVSHTSNTVNQTVTSQQTDGQNIFNNATANQDASIGYVKATKISHPEFTLAAGEVIHATLETAITSQLQGPVRAITTRDIYSLDASHKLIPKGSALMGKYQNAGITPTQDRVLIGWNRVQLPNGIIANLNSPSTDKLGRSGSQADTVDHHFIERFGSSVLFSILGAYTANSGVTGADQFNSASQYRTSLVESFQRTSSESLNQRFNLPPTLNIHQGTEVIVFVDKDVSFYDVLNQGG
ncbi:TPA: TrbI/VirB10 family protein [Legionella pneumophila]|nr:TrbI/VirB10 family protein [Legionella pneumophila]